MRIAAHRGAELLESPGDQGALHVLFGVRIQVHRDIEPPEFFDELHERRRIAVSARSPRVGQLGDFRRQLVRQPQVESHLFAVVQEDRDASASVRLLQLGGRELLAHLFQDVQQVLAGPERVGTKVGTRTVRATEFQPAEAA